MRPVDTLRSAPGGGLALHPIRLARRSGTASAAVFTGAAKRVHGHSMSVLSDEQAARMMAALREGRTLRKFGIGLTLLSQKVAGRLI